ncbi:hypothetical protein D3C73_1087290 [compost metagenome]
MLVVWLNPLHCSSFGTPSGQSWTFPRTGKARQFIEPSRFLWMARFEAVGVVRNVLGVIDQSFDKSYSVAFMMRHHMA